MTVCAGCMAQSVSNIFNVHIFNEKRLNTFFYCIFVPTNTNVNLTEQNSYNFIQDIFRSKYRFISLLGDINSLFQCDKDN